jgi:hypothetical protein
MTASPTMTVQQEEQEPKKEQNKNLNKEAYYP